MGLWTKKDERKPVECLIRQYHCGGCRATPMHAIESWLGELSTTAPTNEVGMKLRLPESVHSRASSGILRNHLHCCVLECLDYYTRGRNNRSATRFARGDETERPRLARLWNLVAQSNIRTICLFQDVQPYYVGESRSCRGQDRSRLSLDIVEIRTANQVVGLGARIPGT